MKMYEAGIVAIAKNENRYLLEWAAYHLALGFQHIWIYDNGSDIKLARVFSRFHSKKYVTVIRWPNATDGRTQINAYNNYLSKFRDRVSWTAVIDIDEMICLKKIQ